MHQKRFYFLKKRKPEISKKLGENRIKALEYDIKRKKLLIEEIKAYLNKYFD